MEHTHINSTCAKASSTLGFLKRNLKHCPPSTQRMAYIAMVRSILEYGAIIWDPYLQQDIDNIERVQRKAARFLTNDYRSRESGCVTQMLQKLDLPTLQNRRKELRLAFLYKIANGLVPALPPESFLTPIRNKRKIKAKIFHDCDSKNIVTSSQLLNQQCFQVPQGTSATYKNSFFPKTIVEWNQLSDNVISASTVETFKTRLHSH